MPGRASRHMSAPPFAQGVLCRCVVVVDVSHLEDDQRKHKSHALPGFVRPIALPELVDLNEQIDQIDTRCHAGGAEPEAIDEVEAAVAARQRSLDMIWSLIPRGVRHPAGPHRCPVTRRCPRAGHARRSAGRVAVRRPEDLPVCAQDAGVFQAARTAIESAGMRVTVVSGGGAEGAFTTHESGVFTELRPGTYVYGDRACIADKSVRRGRLGATDPHGGGKPTNAERAILDAGSKTLTTDIAEAPGVSGYGLILERPGAEIDELSEENARVRL